ncbi:MAG: endonuclease VII domain-containing protein, partial [Actinomycetota bacterium]
CKVCGITKPLTDFYRASGMRDGYRNDCKACLNARHKKWYRKNREYAIKQAQQWKKDNPERHAGNVKRQREKDPARLARINREGHLLRKYGLSLADFEFLVITQGGACRICGKVEGDKLHVDHDHQTGLIRGLLCGNCNKAIGLLEEDADRFAAATSYLRETQLPLSCGDRPRKRTRVVRR